MNHLAQQETSRLVSTSKAPWAALVVDDDAGVRQSLRLCLEAAGARVFGVATGSAALEALDRGHFDVVFLDLWLGADAGLESAARDPRRVSRSWRDRRHGIRLHRERRRRHQTWGSRLRPQAVYARSDPAGGESRGRSAASPASSRGTPGGTGRERRAGVLRISKPRLSAISADDRTGAPRRRTPFFSCAARAARGRTSLRAGFARTAREPTRRLSRSTVRPCPAT